MVQNPARGRSRRRRTRAGWQAKRWRYHNVVHGHWQTDGEQFEATLFATRHSPGPGAFGGIDDLDITLTGRPMAG
jgi:hypothetical protein